MTKEYKIYVETVDVTDAVITSYDARGNGVYTEQSLPRNRFIASIRESDNGMSFLRLQSVQVSGVEGGNEMKLPDFLKRFERMLCFNPRKGLVEIQIPGGLGISKLYNNTRQAIFSPNMRVTQRIALERDFDAKMLANGKQFVVEILDRIAATSKGLRQRNAELMAA